MKTKMVLISSQLAYGIGNIGGGGARKTVHSNKGSNIIMCASLVFFQKISLRKLHENWPSKSILVLNVKGVQLSSGGDVELCFNAVQLPRV